MNRRAYTMQSMRPHPETGRHYYFRPSKEADEPLMLTEETIRRHLEGKITVGLYAINPSTQRCKWVAIDADYKNSMEDLVSQDEFSSSKIEPALEMSAVEEWLLVTSASANICARSGAKGGVISVFI